LKKFPDKDIITLFEEFEENGYVEHICPDCGNECLPTEIDNENAYCENCEETKRFIPVI
jgi:uncharacterized OB-fold protein